MAPATTGSSAGSDAPDIASGPSSSTTPAKPSTTAAMRNGPITCPKARRAISSTKIGAVNSPAATSATGKNASPPK